MTKAEQETVIRWDQDERLAHLWTAYEPDARRWERLGYSVRVFQTGRDGQPRSWSAEVPMEAVRWRPLENGRVKRRRGHRKGRVFVAQPDELVGAEP